jgi:iron complex transport system permease protein
VTSATKDEAGPPHLGTVAGIRKAADVPVRLLKRVLRPRTALFPLLTLLLAVAFLANVGIGGVDIAPIRVLGILLSHAGIDSGIHYTAREDSVLWNIRMPRVVLAMAVGGGLGIAGAALQGIFRNPLADPGLIGVSSGAALGAVLMIIIGTAPLASFSLSAAAFVGAMLMTLLVYGLSRHEGRTDIVSLVLTGVALNAIAGAAIGYLNFAATDAQLRSIVFWSLGSLGGATWDTILPPTLLVALGTIALLRFTQPLNILVLGEREAEHLGVDTERLRITVIVLAALVAGSSVAVAGIVGFVGLVVPHLVRLLAGPDHRTLLPASALAGAALLLGADLAARTVVLPRELPLGVVTAIAGGPYLLWLLRRTRVTGGLWA